MPGIAVLHRRTTTPDGVLVQEAAAGSGVSYGALYDRYAPQVFNYCLRLTDSPEDAGDATQEAFVNVLRRLQDDDRPVLEFSSYLFAAARHESYALMRQRTRTSPSESLPAERGRVTDVDTDPERAILLRDSQEAVREANAQLAPRHREVLALREVAGRSYDEIGQTMGISENAAAQLIWRARAKLREAMTAGAVASVVATSEECETAQMLLSRFQDGEPVEEADRVWLDEHLEECDSCKTANRLLLEVGASYRCWLPVALFAGMRADTLTRAGGLVGADWSHVPATGKGAAAGSSGGGAGTATAATAVVIAAAAIGALALLRDDEPSPVDPGTKQPAASAPAPARDSAKAPPADTKFVAARAPRSVGAPTLAASPTETPRRSDNPAAPETRNGPPESVPPHERPAQPPGDTPRSDVPAPREPRVEPPAPRDSPPVRPAPSPPAPSVDPAPPPPPAECSWPGAGNGPGGCPPGHGGVPPGQGGTPPGRQP